ncbi:hypothetical protein CHL76_09260 [Marinococcus halophilus]|uniref:Uncharacterized protein n=1 Tax=Marinococcus halophilus TaxID=1371 RepID=A0A510Y7C2_MARHA|nr:hypothetical protein [Marinococcus halophilus]OZT80284.1 hypothetical protein CHL76_09260 [Marinococcus halophilus]GEK58347.1 hypothetical protein MHA01_12520 [Marinococcus halophilus]
MDEANVKLAVQGENEIRKEQRTSFIPRIGETVALEPDEKFRVIDIEYTMFGENTEAAEVVALVERL